jgi:arginine-tRNA-protein transferase
VKSYCRWIPYDIARPLLDRKPYVVLSDFAILQNEESSSHVAENVVEVQHEDICQDSNDLCMDEDEETNDPESESSDEESGPDSGNLVSTEIDDGEISDILIGLERSRLRYKVCLVKPQYSVELFFSSLRILSFSGTVSFLKDLRQAFGSTESLESRLHSYMGVVGAELSKRMVYSL